jgi:alpha-tubulin suppressor-like RCC1 family protein
MTTQVTSNNINNYTITPVQLNVNIAPVITSIAICDSSYNVLDDVAANTTGGYIQITGIGFTPNSTIVIGSNNATSVSYVNSSILRAQVGVAAASSYPVYVIDSYTGATCIKVNALTYSSFPAWNTSATLSNQSSNTAFGVNLSANSDSNITYSNTTILPTGTSLLSNGYFYGTVSVGVQTAYSFTVDAKDTENQDALRTFSLTVVVNPSPGLYAWGRNQNGQLGLNDVTLRSSPVLVDSSSSWTSINSGTYVLYYIKSNGTLWSVGKNTQGQLGLNDTTYRSSPVQIGAATNWSLISSGSSYSTLAIKTDGTLWSWGYNAQGQLGSNNIVDRSSPTQVGALTGWTQLYTDSSGNMAIRNGALWVWGLNSFGQLGQNAVNLPANVVSSPIQVGALTNWSKGVATQSGTGVIKTDGTLWTWGKNDQGQLGQNNTTYRSSPTQVGAGTTWSSIVFSAGSSMLATKSDNTLWAWGQNYYGELGQNDKIARSSPTQIGTGTNWSQISGQGGNILAIKTDGTLWTWGSDAYGQLGQNDVVLRSSPVQLGIGTNWSKISSGMWQGFAVAT